MNDFHCPLPIDLALADQLFPAMESAAETLEHILRLYRELDRLFWRNFADVFTGPVDIHPDDRVWSTLIKLRNGTDEPDRFTAEPLLKLAFNNDRVATARSMLAIVLNR